ncbi:hypothetical protein FQN49_003801 [Arthroderma sp. PD_2]|nr:hypothetical protein FQN49_003801 [Arthroderma sp. PD_2]
MESKRESEDVRKETSPAAVVENTNSPTASSPLEVDDDVRVSDLVIAQVASQTDELMPPSMKATMTMSYTMHIVKAVSYARDLFVNLSNRPAEYLFPNDEQESERLDMHHALIDVLLHGRLHMAPIGDNPQRVLDLCTGTGIWAICFADKYPSAEVIGNDLSPTQPSLVPPNLKFFVDDVEDEWGYESSPFDYIHGRFLIASIRDWPKLTRQAFRYSSISLHVMTARLTIHTVSCTKPGGWVEFQDWDGTIRSDDGTLKGTHIFMLQETVKDAFVEIGINSNPGAQCGGWLKEAGFINITTQKIKVPLGTWPKDKRLKTVGALCVLQHLEGLGGMANLPLIKKGWPQKEIQVLLAKAREDLRNRKIHAYFDFYIVHGQKPDSS